jgi:cytochrome d ubiquinol oxidase subunit I
MEIDLSDPVFLARIQFAATMTFHIIFPAFTIGCAAYVATLEGMALFTGRDRYRRLARFWTKIFAVSFAMGVVSGIVMSYQFGTNWSRFSEIVGNVIGPPIAYEVLTAFFLEATFLGVMLFGWNRVPQGLHFAASLVVAVGTIISAFWILSANSWMQHPVGYEMREGIAYPTDWWAIIFNPTFPYRFAHMVNAAFITTALVVLATGARFMLRNRHLLHAETMVRMAIGMLILAAPLQVVIGDLHGLNTLEYQPAKVAAMEAHWPAEEVAPFVIFAIPDQEQETNHYEIAIPHAGSLILTHDWNGIFRGLKAFAKDERPPVLPVFFSFRIMLAIGFFLVALALWGGLLWLRGRLSDAFLRVASLCWPLGFIAIIAGWYTTEIGRQPWVATGILRTADASSPLAAGQVGGSLIMFGVIYTIIFAAGIFYMNRLLNAGPEEAILEDPEGTALWPMSAADRATGAAIRKSGPAE